MFELFGYQQLCVDYIKNNGISTNCNENSGKKHFHNSYYEKN